MAAGWLSAAAIPTHDAIAARSLAQNEARAEISRTPYPARPRIDPEVVAAVRAGDLDTVRELLSRSDDSSPAEDPQAQVILGLYAHQMGDQEAAARLLSAYSDPTGELEDWRHWTLAESAIALDRPADARRALDTLLTRFGRSPLRAAALVEAARLALEEGDLDDARQWVLSSWESDLGAAQSAALDAVAFAVGEALDEPELQRRAASELLAEASPLADELGVLDRLTGGAEPDWNALLSADQRRRRVASLLQQRKPGEALDLLAVVPAERRELQWSLQSAQALTAAHRGVEALAALDGLQPHSNNERAALAWRRAQAARDAGKARRGRANLPSDQREAMRHRAVAELWITVASTDDDGSKIAALRQIYDTLAAEDSFESSLEVLRRLRAMDPRDRTGARDLWQLGWREYRHRNHTGAIGFWAELSDLYPDSSYARGGRYWSAACHTALGNDRRAQAIYRQLAAADAVDFYSRYARIRLGDTPGSGSTAPPRPRESWPTDPRLDRARLLTDLGLDDDAVMEANQLREGAEPRSWEALTGLALSRSGRHREAIPHLLSAFPALGGPRQAGVPEEALRHYYPVAFEQAVVENSRHTALPVDLVLAMIRQESAFDAEAKSRTGARGLMQLMPATAREWAQRLGLPYSTARLHDPDYSIRLGTAYFASVLSRFDGRTELALAGYNGGPNRIRRLWGRAGSQADLDLFVESLSLEESKSYVKRVLMLADSYRQLYPALTTDS